MKKYLVDYWWKIDHFFERRRTLVLLLALVVFLRIPSYFEPYWYGDEAIYLTVGNALNQGKTLYRDIVDHKTPIIYYLARVPNQLSFRLLLTLWMFPTVTAFYYLAQKLLKKSRLAWLATATTIIVTTLPTFEGMIPNGELFVLGFFLPGLAILYSVLEKTNLRHYPSLRFKTFINIHQLIALAKCTLGLKQKLSLLLAGFLFGCAILTKVPAVFDVVAAYLLVGFVVISYQQKIKTKQSYFSAVILLIVEVFWMTLGLILPLILSILYFTLHNAYADYLSFGLLYNFHYTGSWIPTSTLPLASLFYSLKGKLITLCLITFTLIALRHKLKPLELFVTAWTWWALVAASLSNRPYPHYFIQVLPALVLFCFAFGEKLVMLFSKKPSHKQELLSYSLVAVTTILFVLFVNACLGFWSNRYSVSEYYQRLYKVMTGAISYSNYQLSFNPIIADNLLATELILKEQPNELYIWGTNPMLYAQTKTMPSDKFTVLFHVADLGVYDQTVENVIFRAPPFIIVMKNAENPPESLQRYINNNYLPLRNLEFMTIWHRQAIFQ